MDNVKNPTANQQRRKNNFSIENILARPINCQTRDVKQKFTRQNPFQNNHVLFDQNLNSHNNKNLSDNIHAQIKVFNRDNEVKIESESTSCPSENSDHLDDTHSDDGNSSNQSKI